MTLQMDMPKKCKAVTCVLCIGTRCIASPIIAFSPTETGTGLLQFSLIFG